jgi:hypothetical protein
MRPHEPATRPIPSQGALRIADKRRTAPKWTTLGVANALPARSSTCEAGRSARSVITTNCKPIRAPADEPTIT